MSQVDGGAQHTQSTGSAWVKDEPTCILRVWTLLGAWLGDHWASSPAELLEPGRVRGPSTRVHQGALYRERTPPLRTRPLAGVGGAVSPSALCLPSPLFSVGLIAQGEEPTRQVGGWDRAPAPSLGEDWASGLWAAGVAAWRLGWWNGHGERPRSPSRRLKGRCHLLELCSLGHDREEAPRAGAASSSWVLKPAHQDRHMGRTWGSCRRAP